MERVFLLGEDVDSTRLAFEPFDNLDLTKPIRLLPEGTWYRDGRTLKITKQRLLEIEKNFADGLPNFRVPINLDHENNDGKVGNIEEVKYMADGPKGPGLYVTEYDLTDRGKEAVEEKSYDGVSAEVVWTLNGQKYQDPANSKEHDNVLVGMALTPYPFFGHDEVALYTAEQNSAHSMPSYLPDGVVGWDEYDEWVATEAMAEEVQGVTGLFEMMVSNIVWSWGLEEKEKIAALKTLVAGLDERLEGATSGSDHDDMSLSDVVNTIKGFVMRNRKQEKEVEEPTENLKEDPQEDPMADKTKDAPIEDTPNEELTQAQTLAETEKARADKAVEELAVIRSEAETAELELQADSFKALSVEKDTYVENMGNLRALGGELAEWVYEQFAAHDLALSESGILDEIGSDLDGDASAQDRFIHLTENILKGSYEGNMEKWPDALAEAGVKHPKLAAEYLA